MIIDLDKYRSQKQNSQYIEELKSLDSMIFTFQSQLLPYVHFAIVKDLALTLFGSHIIINKHIKELENETTSAPFGPAH